MCAEEYEYTFKYGMSAQVIHYTGGKRLNTVPQLVLNVIAGHGVGITGRKEHRLNTWHANQVIRKSLV
jgi:hypothetical protein